MQRRIQRTLLDLQRVLRQLLEPLGDGVAVQGTGGDDLQDQQVECALQQSDFAAFISTPRLATYDAAFICRT